MGRIIGIGGRLAAGKDTVADYLVGKGWLKFGMSDPLHEAMLTLDPIVDSEPYVSYEDHYGWKEWDTRDVTYQDAMEQYGYTQAKAQYPEVRRLLQVFGTEVGRNLFGENVWSDIMKRRASEASVTHDVIVTGIRFPNEVTAIRDLGGELWWVQRGEDRSEGHASETSVSPTDFDVFLDNRGSIADLHYAVNSYL